MRLALTPTTIAAVLVLTTPQLHAQASSALADWWNGDYVSGDWNGARQRLETRGIHLWLTYEQDLVGNVSGGTSRGIANAGSFEAGALLDFEKLTGTRGTTFLIRFVDRNGTDLTKRTGNFFPVQQDFGDQTFMLQSLAFEHTFFDSKLMLKYGRIAAGDDFSGAAIYGDYMSNAINGAPKALFTTSAFSSYPGSVWGARLTYAMPGSRWTTKAGVYQANDRLYNGHKHGFAWDIRHNDGITIVSEIGYTTGDAPNTNNTPSAAPAQLPGHYRIGGYVSFWDIPRFDGRGTENTTYALYAHADQMLWRATNHTPAAVLTNPAPNIIAWTAIAFAPVETVQQMPWQVSVGLVYQGLAPSRPEDKLVLGISHGHFSDDYAAQQQQQNATTAPVSGETMIELAWRFALNRFTTFSPDIQYILKPAGFSSRSNVVVLGLRLNVVF